MKRIVLGVQYDGMPWRGWQTQPGGGTVQDELESALKKFSLEDIATTCAGRTDAGVHAFEQIVHFDTALDRDPFSWVRGVNAFLPASIAVRWSHVLARNSTHEIREMQEIQETHGAAGFHARFSATARTYHYLLYNHPVRSPLIVGKAGWVFRPLEIEPMQKAADYLIGTHDFSAFRAAECQARTPVKTMHDIQIEKHGDFIVFTLQANAFLHHMVRNIVGSLIFTGNGNQPPEWLKQILDNRVRSHAAPTFMPDGLYLGKITYDAKWGLPQSTSVLFPWL